MKAVHRKRQVSSCIPCYTKKQKCNRSFPCNHCSRRRRPEECVYYSPRSVPAQTATPFTPDQSTSNHGSEGNTQIEQFQGWRKYSAGHDLSLSPSTSTVMRTANAPSLADVFGYSEDSESNTMALVRKFGVLDDHQLAQPSTGLAVIPNDVSSEVFRIIERIPDRPILDLLIQYFVDEVQWIDQLVYIPWFLTQYRAWWTSRTVCSVADAEFAVLMLQICSYSSQFLPSPSHAIDQIRGMLLADIRAVCDEAAGQLSAICTRLHPLGSLVRVQHICYDGLKLQCEGGTSAFCESLRSASRVAQGIGIHRQAGISAHGANEVEIEMRRRVFYNLYTWDSLMSRQLDRTPFLKADALGSDIMPLMHLGGDATNANDADAPDLFTERLLQARLARFWRNERIPRKGSTYDTMDAETQYERFCSDFLASLPAVFALQPNKDLDERIPKLALQRQALHVSIFDTLCYNFRPVLFQDVQHVQSLRQYKQVLLSSQRGALAAAALGVLQKVSGLHQMMGGSYTRFAGIIFPTLEAAVILASLCIDTGPSISETAQSHARNPSETDPLGWGIANLTRNACLGAVNDALARLRTLAEVSSMADVGAKTLARLIDQIPSGSPVQASNGHSVEHRTSNVRSLVGQDENAAASWSLLESELPDLDNLDPSLACTDWEPLINFHALSGLPLMETESNGNSSAL